jgi:hypothetical protein
MAHFALVDGGFVRNVIVVNNDAIDGGTFPDSEPLGQEFIASLPDLAAQSGVWLQCSYSGSFRGAYPGQGWTYDAVADEFIPPPVPITEAL